eukprot:8021029-Pyramimonas_sp.AAC.1
MEAEAATAVGEYSVSVFLDMLKCYEPVIVERLFAEARQVGYPPRMMWMVLASYRCPRVIQAFGSVSRQ